MSAPKNIEEFISKFKKITEMGWVRTHRSGPTGIGKTLEDLLEIPENNIDGPDFSNYELKSMRRSANSMLTLFSKAPKPAKINSYLRDTYGLLNEELGNNEKDLHTTLYTGGLSSIGDTGKSLGVKCSSDKIIIIDNLNKEVAYWNSNELEKAFLKKYKYRMIHVFAESQGIEKEEEFKYLTAWELFDFSFENMITLLKDGFIAIDIRLGHYTKGKNAGKKHDHGTAFRIQERYLAKMFKNKNILVEAD